MNFDVVVEEAPTSPTNTTELWSTLTEQGLLQNLMEMGIPVPPTIIDVIPGLPQYIRDEWKAYIEQMIQGQQQQQAGV